LKGKDPFLAKCVAQPDGQAKLSCAIGRVSIGVPLLLPGMAGGKHSPSHHRMNCNDHRPDEPWNQLMKLRQGVLYENVADELLDCEVSFRDR